MTISKEKDRKVWRYKFYYHGTLYKGSTGQLTREDAEEFETDLKRRVRRAEHGLQVLPEHTPTIAAWADVYLAYSKKKGKIRRLDRIEELLRVVLRFWGAKPSGKDPKHPPIAGEPYHNLRLADPLRDPEWLSRYEGWMDTRRVGTGKGPKRPLSPQTRNHYITIMSNLYRLAMRPQFVKKTGVRLNPFLTIERYPTRQQHRRVALTVEQLRAWLQHTPRHAQLAIAIAALAPKLRLRNVLELRWGASFDPAFRYITVQEHKTVGLTGEPMVVAISSPLRALLQAMHQAWVESGRRRDAVITYRGEPIVSIRAAIRTGAQRADLPYGRALAAGVTFHTIRHTAATLLAELPYLTEAQRSAVMGQDILTTQLYTHLRPENQRPVVEALGQLLDLGTLFGSGSTAGSVPSGERENAGKNEARAAPADQRSEDVQLRK